MNYPSAQIPAEPRPTVTVAVLTRDRRDYLRRTIDSVLASTTLPDRLVVIDNSQRDPLLTRAICDQYERVEYGAPVGDLSQQANHNRAIDYADTDFVCVLHDDDIYRPEFLARGLAALTADPKAGFFAVNYGVIDGEDREVRDRAWYSWRAGTFEPGEFLAYVLASSSPVHFSAAMMRTALARQCRMHEIDRNCADIGFFLQLGSLARVILSNEPLVAIRLHESMMSVDNGIQQLAGSRRSEALAFVPREWATKQRFFASAAATRVLGSNRKPLRVAAARDAIGRLTPHLRGYPIAERLRILRVLASLLPYALGTPARTTAQG